MGKMITVLNEILFSVISLMSEKIKSFKIDNLLNSAVCYIRNSLVNSVESDLGFTLRAFGHMIINVIETMPTQFNM